MVICVCNILLLFQEQISVKQGVKEFQIAHMNKSENLDNLYKKQSVWNR